MTAILRQSWRTLGWRIFLSVFFGGLGYVSASLILPAVRSTQPFAPPQVLGRLNQVDVYLHIGDVVIPNKAVRVTDQGWEFGSRVKYWDSFVITAPVPEVVATKDGDILTIPWTLLPFDVVASVRGLDAKFGDELARSVGLKDDPSQWHFERLARIDVPADADYRLKTGVRAIYAVNMFQFMEDFGTDYESALTGAISRCVMECVQDSGRMKDKSIAIPALAAAQHVVERDLVLPFDEAFSAVLDGVGRVGGERPPQVHLVVWWKVANHPEMRAALSGVETAAFQMLPDWRGRLNSLLAWTLAVAFFVGIVVSLCQRGRTELVRHPVRAGVLLIAAIVGGVGADLTELLVSTLPAAQCPRVLVGLMGITAFWIGNVLEKKLPGIVEIGGEEKSPQGPTK